MFSRLFIAACGIFILMFMAVSLDDAEAKRMGGGRSFGGRTTMSKPVAPPTSAVKPQASMQQNQAAAMPRQGMFGGMGGMLGGLLAGGLLGSLLFGGGMGGMGGFGGLLDILLIGGLLYLLFKFLGRRRAAANAAGGMGVRRAAEATAGTGGDYQQYQARPSPGGMSWDALSSQPGGGAGVATAATQEDTRNIPAGFDENEFLEGAKAAYTRLNASWDSRNLDDIAKFATPAFMDEIRAQAEEDPTPSRTEIMLINANLVEVKEDSGEQMASVFFSVLLRESADQTAPTDVREMWHFVRNADGTGQWRLDGIQQVM